MSEYKLAPVEPTQEMIDAAREHHEGEAYLPISAYKAMLAAAPAVQGVESRPLPANRYGVDCDYFTEKLEILIRDMGNYTPAELARSLGRLAMTADSETMREPEFNTAPAVQGESVGYGLLSAITKHWDGRTFVPKDEADGYDDSALLPLYAAPQPMPRQECGGDGAGGEHEDDCEMAQPECDRCGRTDRCDDDCDAVVIGGHRAVPATHGSLFLSDEKILEIASNPMVSPCSPWWLKNDVKSGDVQNSAIAFARAVLKAAAPTVQVEVVGWQFYQDGKWWGGDDRIKDHRKNTEEAGYPIRDVYVSSTCTPKQQPAADVAGLLICDECHDKCADPYTGLFASHCPDEEPCIMCECSSLRRQLAEQQAALAAAAPELLDALMELADWYREHTGLPPIAANAAIAKVTGGSP